MPRPSPSSPVASSQKKKARPSPSASVSGHLFLLAASLHERPLPAGWLDRFGASDTDIDAFLASAQLIETDDGFATGPAVDRDKFSKTATWSQRRRAHQILAEASFQSPARFEAAAHHFSLAGKPDAAAKAWLRAAETHSKRQRHAAATRSFLSALPQLPASLSDADICGLLSKLESCAVLGRDVTTVISALQDWRETSPWSERPALRAAAALTLAALLGHSARHVDSAHLRRAAARELEASGRPAEAAAAFFAGATTFAYALQFTLALQSIDDAFRAGGKTAAPDFIAGATQLRGFILGMQGHTAQGRAEVERALDIALKHQLPGLAADAYRLLGSVAEYNSCYRDEQAAFAQALSYCRRHNQDVVAGLCLGCLAYSFFRSGNWKRSEAVTRKVLGDRKAHPVSRMVAEGVLGLLHAHRGESRLAGKLLDRSLASGRQMGVTAMAFFSLLGLAQAAEAKADDAAAAAHYRALLETWRACEDRHDAIPGLTCAVSFHAMRGEREETAEYASALELIAASTANPEATGAARFAAAELLLLDGDHTDAATAFRAALAEFEKRDLATEQIRARLRLATALSRKNSADPEARTLLNDAARRARRLGARPLAAQAAALLSLFQKNSVSSATETIGDKAVRTSWDLLSTRQRDIARHLARGAANKEIAASLSLSVRTVEMHVADVLTRLDCRSRTQAAARIASELR